MRGENNRFPVYDTVNATNAIVIHWYQPMAAPAVGYAAVATESECYALLLWPDNSLHIQSINNLQGTIGA